MRLNAAEIRELSVKDYLESRGFKVEQNGNKWFCKSPFSRDTNWSFCIYPSNTYFCWSTGKHGDIISLVKEMENLSFKGALEYLAAGNYSKYQLDYKKFKEREDFWKDFDINKYVNHNNDEREAIISYGQSRSIHSGYHCGVYFTRSPDRSSWVRNPAMMFPHQDVDGNIIGAKFRNINGNTNPRFTTRGRLGFYILDTKVPETFDKNSLWLCESETSSNSLWEHFRRICKPATIISMGGVASAPKVFPSRYKDIENKYLVVDYDGSEQLFQERIKKYEHLNVEPIKLILPKGEDINSLFHRGEMWKVEHLLK